jgi:hypothetical protein
MEVILAGLQKVSITDVEAKEKAPKCAGAPI